MNTDGFERYLREREALAALEGETVEITTFGGPREFLDNSPRPEDYAALARRAYLRGDLSIAQFEAVLDIELGLRPGAIALIAADGPECVIPSYAGTGSSSVTGSMSIAEG